MKLERRNYSFMAPPVGPYVHAVIHNQTLYISGVTAFGTSAQLGPVEDQLKEVFDQIQKMAQAENSDLSNLIKVTVFATELSGMFEARQALFEIYGDNIPASSAIQISGLFAEGLKVEVEAIIALPV